MTGRYDPRGWWAHAGILLIGVALLAISVGAASRNNGNHEHGLIVATAVVISGGALAAYAVLTTVLVFAAGSRLPRVFAVHAGTIVTLWAIAWGYGKIREMHWEKFDRAESAKLARPPCFRLDHWSVSHGANSELILEGAAVRAGELRVDNVLLPRSNSAVDEVVGTPRFFVGAGEPVRLVLPLRERPGSTGCASIHMQCGDHEPVTYSCRTEAQYTKTDTMMPIPRALKSLPADPARREAHAVVGNCFELRRWEIQRTGVPQLIVDGVASWGGDVGLKAVLLRDVPAGLLGADGSRPSRHATAEPGATVRLEMPLWHLDANPGAELRCPYIQIGCAWNQDVLFDCSKLATLPIRSVGIPSQARATE